MVDSLLQQDAVYDGHPADDLAALLHVPRVVAFDDVTSTLDAAHALGSEGAASGTLVLADHQSAGRGRLGRTWHSGAGTGIWLTLLERPADADSIGVLSLRLGIRAARVLDSFADHRVALKWPNDLHIRGEGKLAGILVEARWRAQQLDWLAVGFGLNVEPPRELAAAGLSAGVSRVQVLRELVPALREAAAAVGPLTDAELQEFSERDVARGRRCTEPVTGLVAGIDARGALVVDTQSGREYVRAGSLVLQEEP